MSFKFNPLSELGIDYYESGGGGSSGDYSSNFSPTTGQILRFDDFPSYTNFYVDQLGFGILISGGSVSEGGLSSGEQGRFGLISLNCTSNTDEAGADTAATLSVRLGTSGITWEYGISFKIPTLSDGIDNIAFMFGLSDNSLDTTPSDGILVKYDYDVYGDHNLYYEQYDGTSVTTGDLGFAVTAGEWVNAKITINADADEVIYSINGSNAATGTTNISTDFGLHWVYLMDKPSGANLRTTLVDWHMMRYTPNRGSY